MKTLSNVDFLYDVLFILLRCVFSPCGHFQIDADKAKVNEDGEIDFKEDAKFAQHLKKDEAVSDFAKTKTLAQQRQYLPIFSIRDELLQVTFFCIEMC